MADFAEYVKMFDYTKEAVEKVLFEGIEKYEIKSSEYWSDDFIPWSEENINKEKNKKKKIMVMNCFKEVVK